MIRFITIRWKFLLGLVAGCWFFGPAHTQELAGFHLYHPEENAVRGLDSACQLARRTGRHVFVEIGGNWCIWCARFQDFITRDPQLDSLVRSNYVVYHLNYSKENTNAELLAKYGFPQRFGFPVFLVLDGNGQRLHTQNSGYLESGKTYDREKVAGFFSDWSPAALDPKRYTTP
ncbi:MAG TPA: thioredoxin family protein [Chitinophagaceae bacterium]|nr:thioredoxin family protein [Chitinophagaceae bacterium]